jgi:hypothetical protein
MNTIAELGVIVSWVPPKQETTLPALHSAMKVSGLDPALVKEMSPTVAFNRAIKDLSEKRIIRKVEGTMGGDVVAFQFTRETQAGGELHYNKEAVVYLNTSSGVVTCADPTIQRNAQQLVDNHRAVREPADITRLIQKVFDVAGGDLIPVRQQGGCYFVPQSNMHLLENIRKLLDEIHGKLCEWEVSGKSEATRETVAANVSDHMFALIDELKEKCEGITVKTREDVLARRFQDIATLSAKLEANRTLMTDFVELIEQELVATADALERAATGAVDTDGSVSPVLQGV